MTYPSFVSHWIADVEVPSTGGAVFEKRSPIDDRVVAQVARGGAAEVAHALSAAAGAAEAWAQVPPPKRGAILGRAAQLLREREQLIRRRSSRSKPASRGRTRSPRSPRPRTSPCSWKARAAAFTARRCRARF